LLVRFGARLNAADDEGDSPLHWAVREGKVEAAQALVQLGASIEQCNEDGESPLELAVSLEDELMAKHLVFLGAKEQRRQLPTLIVTDNGCPTAMVEDVHHLEDKTDVSMMDVSKDLRSLSVKDDDWRTMRTVSI